MSELHSIKYGVVGENLAHSLAPEVHNQFFDAYSLDGVYDIIDTDLHGKGLTYNEILSSYKGVNVSSPYKELIINHLDSISDNARAIGSVNTINNVDGKLFGYNTDVEGFRGLIAIHNLNCRGKNIVILGSGGTARSVVFVLKKSTKNITVVSLNENEKIEGATVVGYNKIGDLSGDILINATPVGMYPNINDCIVGEKVIEKFEYIIDLVYNPYFTKFLKLGIKNGKKCISGLYMLVSQAMRSESFWQGFDMEGMTKRVYSQINIIEKKKANANIYVIGMMGCGKTEMSKKIAKATGRQFIELDKMVEKLSGKKIDELYDEGGEELFRQWEEKAIIKVAQMKNKVVAVGCGAVLREKNLLTLKLSGIVILRDRPIEKILQDIDLTNRRGVSNKDDVINLYNKRYSLYVGISDYILPYGDIELDLSKILEILR